jgi:hypothetical protein
MWYWPGLSVRREKRERGRGVRRERLRGRGRHTARRARDMEGEGERHKERGEERDAVESALQADRGVALLTFPFRTCGFA